MGKSVTSVGKYVQSYKNDKDLQGIQCNVLFGSWEIRDYNGTQEVQQWRFQQAQWNGKILDDTKTVQSFCFWNWSFTIYWWKIIHNQKEEYQTGNGLNETFNKLIN